MLKKPFSIAREIIEEALTRAHSKISMKKSSTKLSV